MIRERFLLGCPCGYRPPRTDDLEGWLAWYDHLAESHPPEPVGGGEQL